MLQLNGIDSKCSNCIFLCPVPVSWSKSTAVYSWLTDLNSIVGMHRLWKRQGKIPICLAMSRLWWMEDSLSQLPLKLHFDFYWFIDSRVSLAPAQSKSFMFQKNLFLCISISSLKSSCLERDSDLIIYLLHTNNPAIISVQLPGYKTRARSESGSVLFFYYLFWIITILV